MAWNAYVDPLRDIGAIGATLFAADGQYYAYAGDYVAQQDETKAIGACMFNSEEVATEYFATNGIRAAGIKFFFTSADFPWATGKKDGNMVFIRRTKALCFAVLVPEAQMMAVKDHLENLAKALEASGY